MQGKMVGEYVLANFDKLDLNKDGKISYAMFKGEEGNAEAIYRTQFGVEDADKVLTAATSPLFSTSTQLLLRSGRPTPRVHGPLRLPRTTWTPTWFPSTSPART